MSDDFDLALHAKAEFLDFEVGSLKAQLAFANRRIESLEIDNTSLLEQLMEARDAYDELSLELAQFENPSYCHGGCR